MSFTALSHKNLLYGLSQALKMVFFDNALADKTLEKIFRQQKKWGKRDRAAVAEAFYDCIRWKNTIEYWSGKPLTPDYMYHFITAYYLSKKVELPAWPEFSKVFVSKIKKRISSPLPTDELRLGFPSELLERIKTELPESWDDTCMALNQPAKVVLRCNTLKISLPELQQHLAEIGISSVPIENHPHALLLEQKADVFKTEAFKKGWFEVQDASSQKVAEMLNPQPGMRVIDACAGAGGKSLHMAALMKNKGQIIALDIHEWKLEELKKRAKRAGVHCIQTKIITDNKVIKRLKETADKVLIDAPCSGTGVLKRNPDAKWKFTNAQLERLIQNQKEILKNYSSMVKVGGELIYATCSILPSENERQVQTFLKEFSNFKLVEEHIITPSISGFDGFYIGLMKRVS